MLDVVITCMQFAEMIERMTGDKAATLRLAVALMVVCPAANWEVLSAPHANAGNLAAEGQGAFAALLALPSDRLERVDIARMNLLCAEDLPGATGLDLKKHLAQIDDWASRVRLETERHNYRFQRNPVEFDNSEGFFRMMMLAVVLAEDFGVHYDSRRRGDPAAASASDGFFADSRNVFLHGLLGPERRGTCSSLPVLYVAVGRRLGYPLKLVATKGHLFARWEGRGERFNVEAASEGLNKFDDAYYRHWPYTVTDEEMATEGYLKSLSPAEELAAFLSIRGLCLKEAVRMNDAAESFAAATRLAPNCLGYKILEQRCRAQPFIANEQPKRND